MFGAILLATNSSFQKGITICRSVYVKKVMKLSYLNSPRIKHPLPGLFNILFTMILMNLLYITIDECLLLSC